MDFSESDRVRGFRQTVREFMKKEIYPLETQFRRDGFAAVLPRLKQTRIKAKETGLWAAHLPTEWGGAGLSLTEFAHLSEELGRSPLGHYVFNVQAPDVGNMELLLSHGTDEQRDRWLRPLVRGDIRSCFTMTEPEFAGSNPVWMGTTAVKDGGSWVIRGHKWFSTAADGAASPRQLAPGDLLGSRQLVQQGVAESRGEIDGARLMVLHAAWTIERKGTSEARDEISIIKFTVARTVQRVLDRAIQALGALGLTDETPLAFWWTHERGGRLYDGADQVHITPVAQRILRRYRGEPCTSPA